MVLVPDLYRLVLGLFLGMVLRAILEVVLVVVLGVVWGWGNTCISSNLKPAS